MSTTFFNFVHIKHGINVTPVNTVKEFNTDVQGLKNIWHTEKLYG